MTSQLSKSSRKCTWENHSEVNAHETSTLFQHQEINVKKTHEFLGNLRIISARSPILLNLIKLKERKYLNVVTARNLFTRSPTSLNIRKHTQEEEPCDNNKCGKSFQKAQNTIQQRTDVRKKTCECDKAPGKSAITKQQKKLYVCDECKKSFHQISALKLSQSTHT